MLPSMILPVVIATVVGFLVARLNLDRRLIALIKSKVASK